jgi:hypothetical protein
MPSKLIISALEALQVVLMKGKNMSAGLRKLLQRYKISQEVPSITACDHGYMPNTCPYPLDECENAHPQDIVMVEPSLAKLPPPPEWMRNENVKFVFPTILMERRKDAKGEWKWAVKEVVPPGQLL